MRYKTEEGRPLCRYCKKLLPPFLPVERYPEYAGRYGRNGSNFFCTLSCTEEWAMRRLAGRSVPRGKSHEE